MAIYDIYGTLLSSVNDVNGTAISTAYDISGNVVFNRDTPPEVVDYSNYSYVQKWESKGIGSTQGFDIYDDKVFWVSKKGNTSISSNCYVWNLSDGSQALESQPITVYSGHGNNLSFDAPKLYATSAYTPHVYVNIFTNDFVFTLDKTLYITDGCTDCDACIDESDKSVLWTLGHMGGSATQATHLQISKWNLNSLTQSGDYYEPELIQSVETPIPSNSPYFQGIRFHDGILWFACGYPGSRAYVYGLNPNTGAVEYTINLETTAEPEGIAFYPDSDAVGGYAMYVGFQGMPLRKYTFGALANS